MASESRRSGRFFQLQERPITECFSSCGHSPLTLRVGRHTLYTSAILLPILLRVEEVPIDLHHAGCPRDVADDCESRHPEVAGKDGP